MNDSTIWALIAPLLVIQLFLTVFALVVCARAAAVRGPKWLWVLIILFCNIIGPVLFLAAGRRRES